jgi:hypothetical protein
MNEQNFENLKKYVGGPIKVLVITCDSKKPFEMAGTLRHVEEHRFIILESDAKYRSIPFVGNTEGILEIKVKVNKKPLSLYENELLSYFEIKGKSKSKQLQHANYLRTKSFDTEQFNLSLKDDDYFTAEADAIAENVWKYTKGMTRALILRKNQKN